MKLGIAFSGGGIRGIAHAGVLKAFEENNIIPSMVAGTSSGSFVAVLYSMGFNADEILKLFKDNAKDLIRINNLYVYKHFGKYMLKKTLYIQGITQGDKIEKIYNQLANERNIKKMCDLKLPTVIPSVDLVSEKKFVFSSEKIEKEEYIFDISVGEAVRASSCFPGLFEPVNYKKHIFLDGGILDNIPTNELRKIGAEKIISIKFQSGPIHEKSNLIDILMKTLDIMGEKICEDSINESDFTLDVEVGKVGLLDINKIDECFEKGYQEAIKQIKSIKNIINSD